MLIFGNKVDSRQELASALGLFELSGNIRRALDDAKKLENAVRQRLLNIKAITKETPKEGVSVKIRELLAYVRTLRNTLGARYTRKQVQAKVLTFAAECDKGRKSVKTKSKAVAKPAKSAKIKKIVNAIRELSTQSTQSKCIPVLETKSGMFYSYLIISDNINDLVNVYVIRNRG